MKLSDKSSAMSGEDNPEIHSDKSETQATARRQKWSGLLIVTKCSYVGETGRTLMVRQLEHRRYLNNEQSQN